VRSSSAGPTALQIQIWTALIALLVLKNLQLRDRFGWSRSNLAALLRQQLFVIATSGPESISPSSGRRCWMPLPSRFPFLGHPTWTAVIEVFTLA
jgi:hypothetical protein